MAEKNRSDPPKKIQNPLLTAAGSGFPFENFTGGGFLMPVSQRDSPILPEDVGEPDSFIGQNAPTLPAPLVTEVKPILQSATNAEPKHKLPYSSGLFSPPLTVPSPKPRGELDNDSHLPFAGTRSDGSVIPEVRSLSLQETKPQYPYLASQPATLSSSSLVTELKPSLVAPVSKPEPQLAFNNSFSQPPTVSSGQSQGYTSTFAPSEPANTPQLAFNSPFSQPPPVSSGRSQAYTPTVVPSDPVNTPQLAFNNSFSRPPASSGQSIVAPSDPAYKSHLSNYFKDLPETNEPFAQPFLVSPANPPPRIQPPAGFAPQPFSSQSVNYTPQSTPSFVPQPFSTQSVSNIPQSTSSTENKSLFLSSISPALLHPTPTPSPPAFHPSPSATPPVESSPGPRLFTPIGQPPLPTSTVPLSGGSNTYRLGSQKRLVYAQPPGLSIASPKFDPSTSVPPVNYTPANYPTVPPLVPPSAATYASTPLVAPGPGSGMATTMTSVPTVSAGGPVSGYQPAASLPEPSVIPPSFNNLSQGQPIYREVYHHWFRKKEVETKILWEPFSFGDSMKLESVFKSPTLSEDMTVPTDGGRYDVNVVSRQRLAVYWEEQPTEVRRCSWFYKGSADSRFVPYEENVADKLEEEYATATRSNQWHRRVEFPNGESVVFHGPNVMVHFPQPSSPDAWGNTPQIPTRPRVVKRGVDEFDIDEGEPPAVDHLLLLVHGVGSACDLRFRSVEEVVDDFRSLSLQLVKSHFRTSVELTRVNRIEVLPVSWHATLHGEDTGIDRKLKSITLHSIPKLRHFTNDTLLDILFYTSPVFCQTIMHTVGKEINRLYELFQTRNPDFKGGVSLGGHSLGSLILFDLLCHQKPPITPGSPQPDSREGSLEPISLQDDDSKDTIAPLANIRSPSPNRKKLSHRVSYVMGNAGTGQAYITYPQLNFSPAAFYAMGSPIGMFVTVRGIDALGDDFKLPTCPAFFNIFHPFDPVAYRIEALINPDFVSLKPVMVPHHKGRKRMHLELKETMARVGADLKQKLLDSVRSTWNTVYQLAMFHRADGQALEQEVDKVLEEQLKQQETESNQSNEEADPNVQVGQLNGGRRVDYVLQEAPLESFNEYLFALGSHVCYWESEDTMLMILKEIYAAMGISPDSNVPQTSSNYDRPSSSSTPHSQVYPEPLVLSGSSMSSFVGDETDRSATLTPSSSSYHSPVASESQPILGMDPTAPPSENKSIGPPPMGGFIRK